MVWTPYAWISFERHFFRLPQKLLFGKCRHLEETYAEWWWNIAMMKVLKINLWQTWWHCRMCACEAHWSQRSEGLTKQTLRLDVGHYNYYHLRIRPALVMINLHYQEEHLHNAMLKTKKIQSFFKYVELDLPLMRSQNLNHYTLYCCVKYTHKLFCPHFWKYLRAWRG